MLCPIHFCKTDGLCLIHSIGYTFYKDDIAKYLQNLPFNITLSHILAIQYSIKLVIMSKVISYGCTALSILNGFKLKWN